MVSVDILIGEEYDFGVVEPLVYFARRKFLSDNLVEAYGDHELLDYLALAGVAAALSARRGATRLFVSGLYRSFSDILDLAAQLVNAVSVPLFPDCGAARYCGVLCR